MSGSRIVNDLFKYLQEGVTLGDLQESTKKAYEGKVPNDPSTVDYEQIQQLSEEAEDKKKADAKGTNAEEVAEAKKKTKKADPKVEVKPADETETPQKSKVEKDMDKATPDVDKKSEERIPNKEGTPNKDMKVSGVEKAKESKEVLDEKFCKGECKPDCGCGKAVPVVKKEEKEEVEEAVVSKTGVKDASKKAVNKSGSKDDQPKVNKVVKTKESVELTEAGEAETLAYLKKTHDEFQGDKSFPQGKVLVGLADIVDALTDGHYTTRKTPEITAAAKRIMQELRAYVKTLKVGKTKEGKVPADPSTVDYEQIQQLSEDKVLATTGSKEAAESIKSKYPESHIVEDSENEQFLVMVKEGVMATISTEDKTIDVSSEDNVTTVTTTDTPPMDVALDVAAEIPMEEEIPGEVATEEIPMEEEIPMDSDYEMPEEEVMECAERVFLAEHLEKQESLTEKERAFVAAVKEAKYSEKNQEKINVQLEAIRGEG